MRGNSHPACLAHRHSPYLIDAQTLTDGCRILNATSHASGGAIYLGEDGVVELAQGSSIARAMCRGWGGAIYGNTGSRALVVDSTIARTRALQGNGGAIIVDGGHITLLMSTVAHVSW